MANPPPNERPTAAELQAMSSGKNPWACPRCGCAGPHRVVNSYEVGGERKRRRFCRNCKQLIRTVEVPVPEGFEVRVVPEDEELEDGQPTLTMHVA